MPISQEIEFICEKCGYKEFRLIGDCLPDNNMFKSCPKCGNFMQVSKENETIYNIIEIYRPIFEKSKN